MKGKRKLFEAPKPHYYYHLEYKLFPNDPDPVKADVVTYGVAAKIYSESDSKVLKTWCDGEKTWVTWTHRLVKCSKLHEFLMSKIVGMQYVQTALLL